MGQSKVRKGVIVAVGVLAIIVAAVVMLLRPDPAPQPTVTALNGQPLSLASLKGKVVMVNFWATSCPGCVKEMPELVNLYQNNKAAGFEVVAVAMQYDPADYVRNFTAQKGLPFTVALDADGSASQAFGGVKLTPTSFLIDRQGNLVQQFIGEPDFAALDKVIKNKLGEKA